jgi:hypothetical protein
MLASSELGTSMFKPDSEVLGTELADGEDTEESTVLTRVEQGSVLSMLHSVMPGVPLIEDCGSLDDGEDCGRAIM